MRELLDELKRLEHEATPGEYETRCRELSNHAGLEIWTDFGWLDKLPFSYREPTYKSFVALRNASPVLIEALEIAMRVLKDSHETIALDELDALAAEAAEKTKSSLAREVGK